jgi:hypothetical protein
MSLKEAHKKLVYFERGVIVLPITFLIATFSLLSASEGIAGVLVALMFSPLLLGGMCLGYIYRFFNRQVSRGFIAPMGTLLCIWYGAVAARITLEAPYIHKQPPEGWLFFISAWFFSIIGIHWLGLFAFRFELVPRRMKPPKSPDNF